MIRISICGLVLTTILLFDAHAVTFNHIVTLGDSLLDDTGGDRSPVAAEHVAKRLGVPLTKFAESGSTSTALIDQGQHTQAAVQFGAGDLAMLWIGGNDFFSNPFEITFGGTDFLDTLESNVDTVMSTLNNTGMEIVAFNLPDMSQVPGVIDVVEAATILTPFLRRPAFENITDATIQWNTRLNSVASTYGATVVDVFTIFNNLSVDPDSYSLLDHAPILNANTGCQYCVFFDDILLPDVHPSSFAQGFIANDAIVAINKVYDFQGAMPLELLSIVELALLADLYAGDFDENNIVDASDLGRWETNFGLSGSATHFQGDANGDLHVNGSDILIWQQQHAGNFATQSASVPEPGSLTLALLACYGLRVKRLVIRSPAVFAASV